jgi:microcin C transport system substrate-binding protein
MLGFLLLLVGCNTEELERGEAQTLETFAPTYNAHIKRWLQDQQTANSKAIAEAEAELASATDAEAERIQTTLDQLRREAEKWDFRLGLGDYLKTGTPEEIPSDLDWQTGLDEPEIGDPKAKKGGAFRRFVPSFPPTIRPFGDNSNNSFRGDLYDYIELGLVTFHPETMAIIPAVANEWATAADGRTTYFRIDPEATYSDGTPVKARDFQLSVFLRISDYIINPYSKQYFRENIAQVAVYDERTLSVSLPEASLYSAAIAGGLTPSHPGFYQDYGPDYAERYQWKFPPTTGAYIVRPDDIVKGASITQTRVEDWWARDRKYYRYRFNPDKIVNTVVRDESKAFELFRAGELDTFFLTRPEHWYEKSEMEPVYNGYIERVTFYTRYPKVPRGLYLNVRKAPLDNLDVRIGIQHAMNWQKVIDVMFRSDYQRLNAFNEGYVNFSDPSIRARPFSIAEARAAFARAGYTEEGRDGILMRPGDKARLSVAITYPAMPIFDRMFAILREEALKCGFELRLDGLEATVAYTKEMQKQHEMCFGSWLITPPMPDFHQFLHSTNALDERGNPKPQTNNLFVWGRKDTDELSGTVRNGRTVGEIRDAAWKLQRIMHDEALFVPAYAVDFVRIGSWRWVRWPDSENTRFSPPVVYDPHEVLVMWIDDDIKAETQAARRIGKAFPESTRVVDAYRETTTPIVDPPADLEVPKPSLPEP